MSDEVQDGAPGGRNLVDRVARKRRAVLAGHEGDAATARGLLDDADPSIRSAALGALARCGRIEARDLRTAVADPEAEVRVRAAQVVASLATDDRPPWLNTVPLLPLLDDPDPSVVEVGAWVCGERLPPDDGTVARLAALVIDHEDALVREAAVAALGAIGDPAGLPAVLAATRDRATVRRRAVLALAPFEGPEVDEALGRAGEDRDWQVRQAAEDLEGPSR